MILMTSGPLYYAKLLKFIVAQLLWISPYPQIYVLNKL